MDGRVGRVSVGSFGIVYTKYFYIYLCYSNLELEMEQVILENIYALFNLPGLLNRS